MSARAPLIVGVLADHPAAGGASFARVVRLAFADVRTSGRLDRELCLVEEQADGLPRGSAAAVEAAFGRLRDQGAVAIIGPAISDNGLVVRELADATGLPCINWTGGEQTRSAWMFQYQVGSLEEEPGLLALHLATQGVRRVAVLVDDSIVGLRCHEFFTPAAQRAGLTLDVQITFSTEDPVDYGAIVQSVRSYHPEAIVYLGLWSAAHGIADALAELAWRPRMLANSALMYGHASPEWARAWHGWRYVDAYSDGNTVLRGILARLGEQPGVAAVTAAAAYDMGRLVAEGIASAPAATRAGVKDGLERVKLMPAALGADGTTMGFGNWERAALKGRYLVLREWLAGRSVEVETP